MVNTRANSQRDGATASVTPPAGLNGAGNARNNNRLSRQARHFHTDVVLPRREQEEEPVASS